MNFGNDNNEQQPRVELTSLVDVVFLLVLFFAVTTTFPKTPAGVKIKLPKMKNVAAEKPQSPLEIFIDKDGKIYYKNAKITTEKLKEIIKRDKKKTVIVDADARTSHGEVMKVLDFLKGSGVERILIAAEKNAGKENTGIPKKSR